MTLTREQLVATIAVWAQSDAGKAAIDEALRLAGVACEQLAAARKVDWAALHIPIAAAQAQGADGYENYSPCDNYRPSATNACANCHAPFLAHSAAQEPPATPAAPPSAVGADPHADLVRELKDDIRSGEVGPNILCRQVDKLAAALEAQRGEIARIKEWGDHLLRKAVDAKTLKREAERELAAARDLAAQLSLDAKRYRWLRQFPTDTQQFGRRYWDDELDAAIDTLRAALKDAP